MSRPATSFEDALAICLDDLSRGASPAECLARFPEHAAELAPLLQVAARTQAQSLPALSLRGRVRGRERMHAALAQPVAGPGWVRAWAGGVAGLAFLLVLAAGIWLSWPGRNDRVGGQPTVQPTTPFTRAERHSTPTLTAGARHPQPAPRCSSSLRRSRRPQHRPQARPCPPHQRQARLPPQRGHPPSGSSQLARPRPRRLLQLRHPPSDRQRQPPRDLRRRRGRPKRPSLPRRTSRPARRPHLRRGRSPPPRAASSRASHLRLPPWRPRPGPPKGRRGHRRLDRELQPLPRRMKTMRHLSRRNRPNQRIERNPNISPKLATIKVVKVRARASAAPAPRAVVATNIPKTTSNTPAPCSRLRPMVRRLKSRSLGRRGGRCMASGSSGKQLVEIERLDQVVVGAGIQPGDPVGDAILGGEHQNREGRVPQPQAPADLQPIHSRQHHIQHDDVRRPVARRGQGRLAGGRRIHHIAGETQPAAQQTQDLRLVVHHQYARWHYVSS